MRSISRRGRTRRPLSVDALEIRSLMTAGLKRGGVLDIRGTQRDDMIEVRLIANDPTRLQVVENGRVTYQDSVANVKTIRIQGLGGNDRLVIDESAGPIHMSVRIDGGRGDDTMKGGSGADEIIGDSGRDIVLPSGGADTDRNVKRPGNVIRLGSTNAFRDLLTRMAKGRSKFGVGTWRGDTGAPDAPVPVLGGDGRASTSTPGSSQTNTQVAGIDEGDLIENDGRNLYILSRGELLIVDAGDPDAPVVKSRTTVEGSPIAIYLHNGRLTVISSRWKDTITPPGDRVIPMIKLRGTGEVAVTVYDTSDTSAPRKVSTTTLDGWYSDSRMVDGKLALVLQNDLMAGYWSGPFAATTRMAAPAYSSVNDTKFARLIKKASILSSRALLPPLSALAEV